MYDVFEPMGPLTHIFFAPGRRPHAIVNIQTEIVNGERGHYLVWSVRVKG